MNPLLSALLNEESLVDIKENLLYIPDISGDPFHIYGFQIADLSQFAPYKKKITLLRMLFHISLLLVLWHPIVWISTLSMTFVPTKATTIPSKSKSNNTLHSSKIIKQNTIFPTLLRKPNLLNKLWKKNNIMKFVNKEYFACKCIEEINSCQYLYRQQIKNVISSVQQKFQITVPSITETELEQYIANEIKTIWCQN